MTSTSRHPAIIVGGGVSGLSAAYFLQQAGIRPVLIEKANRLGGLIQTDLIDGCELEAGPDSFIAAKPAVAALAKELGIDTDIIGSNDPVRRIFIVKNGRLTPMPPGMVFMVPGDLEAALDSDFFTAETKTHFREELDYLPRTRANDVSIREFVTDHFGEECLDYLTEPLLSGVYGGDAGSLSASSVLPRFLQYERETGSLIRSVQKERSSQKEQKTSLFLSFRGGMQTFTDALAKAVLPKARVLRAEVSSVEKLATDGVYTRPANLSTTDNLVLACPAHVNANLLRTAAPSLQQQLSSIPYSSALLVTLVYDRSRLGHPLDGFGFLVPSRERHGVAAGTWVSTKFPSRTPPDRAALRAFIVGNDALELMERDDSELVNLATDGVRPVYGHHFGAAILDCLPMA